MPFLIWNRRVAATNSGSAVFPVTEASGIGHIVVEEIDGSAEYAVTTAAGTGRVASPPSIVPVVGRRISRPSQVRIAGSGAADLQVTQARGRATVVVERQGAGRAVVSATTSVARGRVEHRIKGQGSAEYGQFEIFGSGVVVGPDRRPVSIRRNEMQRPGAVVDANDYDGYVAPMLHRRKASITSQVDDELDELMLMEIL